MRCERMKLSVEGVKHCAHRQTAREGTRKIGGSAKKCKAKMGVLVPKNGRGTHAHVKEPSLVL